MQQAADFLEESRALNAALVDLPEAGFARATQFKGWTVTHVLQHLHFFNMAADEALHAPEAFRARYARLRTRMDGGETMAEATDALMDGHSGHALRQAWADFFTDMARRWGAVDPKTRVEWVGPSMSARS